MDHLVNMKRIAIIPARGGSRRIPRKNVIDFLGKPMIAWTIEAALQSGCFTRVVVSTEDTETAAVAREWGAQVPFMREQHADDQSPVSLATHSALLQASNYWREEYDVVGQLMPNCPLRGAEVLENAIEAFDAGARDFQISCFRFGWMNPWWGVSLGDDGRPSYLFPEALAERSQDLPELYCPTGAIWLAQTGKFMEEKTFYGPGHRFEPLPLRSAVDIDDYDDLAFAGALACQNR